MSENGKHQREKGDASTRNYGSADFLCLGDKLHGAFPSFIWKLIHSPSMNYVSKWVESITCPRNYANTVVGFI